MKRLAFLLLTAAAMLSLAPRATAQIIPGPGPIVLKYPVSIGGVHFSRDKTTMQCGEGKATYNPLDKTLTLEGATIEGEIKADYPAKNELETFTIELIGKNTAQRISLNNCHTVIEGDGSGKLTLNANRGTGIFHSVDKGNLTIKNCEIEVINGAYGISSGYDMEESSELLHIISSKITLDCTESAINDFVEIKFTGCEIASPDGAEVGPSVNDRYLKAIVNSDGSFCTGVVKIEPTSYPVSIAGKTFRKSLTEIRCGEGRATYDDATKTLTLKNATITGDVMVEFMEPINQEFRLILEGENSITGMLGIYYCNATIEGRNASKLTVTNPTGIAIDTEGKNCTLTIKNSVVVASGDFALNSNEDSEHFPCALKIINSTITANGERGSIQDFRNITLELCDIVAPSNVKIGSKKGSTLISVVDKSSKDIFTGEVKIRPVFPISINGEKFSLEKTEIPCGQGKATYDDATKTLTLDNATVSGSVQVKFVGNPVPFCVKLIGENRASGFWCYNLKSLTLEGPGSLHSELPGNVGLIVQNVPEMTIKECTVIAKSDRGIKCLSGETALTVIHAEVIAHGPSKYKSDGSFCNFGRITLEECEIVAPAGAKIGAYNSTQAVLNSDGTLCKEEVHIKPLEVYPVKIGEHHFTPSVGKIDGANGGSATYDHASHTLTLREFNSPEAVITIGDESNTSDVHFTVQVTGAEDSEIKQLSIKKVASVTVKGKVDQANLYVENEGGKACEIQAGELIFTEIFIVVSGTSGIAGTAESSLTINQSVVQADCSSAAISSFQKIALNDCGPTFNAMVTIGEHGGLKAIVDSESNLATKVFLLPRAVILPLPDGNPQSFLSTPPEGVSVGGGTLIYDKDSRTLTLNSVVAEASLVIYALVEDDFTVKLIGENSLLDLQLQQANSLTIMSEDGAGSLSMKNGGSDPSIFWVYLNELTIRRCALDLEGPLALAGGSDSLVALVIEDAAVKIKADDLVLAGPFKSITLNKCRITSPAGAHVKQFTEHALTLWTVMDENDEPVKELTIARGNDDDPNAVESHLLSGAVALPNPFGGWLRVDNAANAIRYALYNALGHPVLAGSHDGQAQLQLETAALPCGVYLLRLEAADGATVIKVVKL